MELTSLYLLFVTGSLAFAGIIFLIGIICNTRSFRNWLRKRSEPASVQRRELSLVSIYENKEVVHSYTPPEKDFSLPHTTQYINNRQAPAQTNITKNNQTKERYKILTML
ncbi:MAG: hypothetical protein HUU54_16945 [Ignavibacteriaceae bacterium]|nr:hypothetical protein [Ignavibacteriaceae bacterium]